MKSEDERNLFNSLESAEANLSDDLQALGYLQDEYFIYNNPKSTFQYSYWEIQNALMILFKSMSYNRDYIRKCIEDYTRK